jgi:CheY-like chemotaxis protein
MIVDDYLPFAQVAAGFLASEFEIIGIADSGPKLLEGAPSRQPDVVLLDLNMPCMSGYAAAAQLKKLMPWVKVVFMTADDSHDGACVCGGEACPVVNKTDMPELAKAISRVLAAMEGEPRSRAHINSDDPIELAS